VTNDELTKFAQRYAKAWCSQNPDSVAAFHAENGSLRVNDGPPAMGRAAIAEEARGFMTTFPDMVVAMDEVTHESPKLEGGAPARPSSTTNFGRSTRTGSSKNRKAISTARSTNVSSSRVSMASAGCVRFDV
jgi:SnoaL-like polyketide cyclase